ncbi:hypothetical protein DMC30DRAFT_450002 [Rhodotorula diobovata]|uniref:Uncharacterized protein n=1 Tax=Rhodotorula diobovata TaxID=5288 RepID=A0A5C5FMR1_9BASI|nr:hypothetical protein DMC30DRAFT_450002 [Rhodotorula diobovata]
MRSDPRTATSSTRLALRRAGTPPAARRKAATSRIATARIPSKCRGVTSSPASCLRTSAARPSRSPIFASGRSGTCRPSRTPTTCAAELVVSPPPPPSFARRGTRTAPPRQHPRPARVDQHRSPVRILRIQLGRVCGRRASRAASDRA